MSSKTKPHPISIPDVAVPGVVPRPDRRGSQAEQCRSPRRVEAPQGVPPNDTLPDYRLTLACGNIQRTLPQGQFVLDIYLSENKRLRKSLDLA